MSDHLLGLDIGGTKLAAVVADGEGRILHKIRRRTRPDRGVEPIIDEMCAMVAECAAIGGTQATDARALGVSFGGPLDAEKDVVHAVPNLPGWGGVPLRARLEEALPGLRIVVENDANAAALAEWRFGAGRGYRCILYTTMGTGIGGGIVVDGEVLRGATGCAGEIGHVCLDPEGPPCACGNRGCLEAFCSGPSIARRAAEKLVARVDPGDLGMLPAETLSTESLVAAAQSGNGFALDHIRETAQYMAQGIGAAVNLLNPDVVILGTVATAAGDVFFEPLRDELPRFVMPPLADAVQVLPAELGDMVGDYAAISLVLD